MEKFIPKHGLPNGVARIEVAANNGIPYAQWLLGNHYMMGTGGLIKDLKQAELLFKAASKSGLSIAQRSLAALLDGKLSSNRSGRAFAAWVQAADNADSAAQLHVGRAYFFGIAVQPDLIKAKHYLQLAAWNAQANGRMLLAILVALNSPACESPWVVSQALEEGHQTGDLNSTFALGLIAVSGWGRSGPEVAMGLDLVKKAASAGHMEAAAYLGSRLIHRSDTVKDHSTGIQLLNNAALNGHPEALAELGNFHANGEYPDYSMAITFYDRALASGYSGANWYKAQAEIARTRGAIDPDIILMLIESALSSGFQEAKTMSPGIREYLISHDQSSMVQTWLKKHAWASGSRGMFLLVCKYFNSADASGDISDQWKGIFWLEACVAEGDDYSMECMAEELMRGTRCQSDPASAVALLNTAASLGRATSATRLAYYFNFSSGLIKNHTYAATINEFSAVAGDSVAQKNLAQQFYHGEGISVDRNLGDYWFQKGIETNTIDETKHQGMVSSHKIIHFQRKTDAKIIEFKPTNHPRNVATRAKNS